VPTPPADLRKQFIKVFDDLARHRERHDVLADFLEMAFCAIRKKTLPAGAEADAIEERYMAVVRRNKPEDVRQAIPKLFGITALAVQDGGCDFLGQVVVELELPSQHMGQFFTPYDVSRMIAELTLDTVEEIIAEQGFVTVQEPACGAGGMIIAAADVLARKGFDVARQLYVEAIDISPLCFRMSYLQASLRGIPAAIRRGNTLSGEVFETAVTPAFFGFYASHKAAFDAWQRGEGRGGTASYDAEITQRDGEAQLTEPEPAAAEPVSPDRRRAPGKPRQLSLFD
jgi:type I restriction-modification system DNA methylase subunit